MRISDWSSDVCSSDLTTRARVVARTEFVEQLLHRIAVTQARERETTVVNRIRLGARNQRLGQTTQLLGLRQGGLDELVLEQRNGDRLHRRFAVAGATAERAARHLVTHGLVSRKARKSVV